MSEPAMEALRAAVNLARNESIRTVAALRNRLLQAGFCEQDADEALLYWANHEKSKPRADVARIGVQDIC